MRRMWLALAALAGLALLGVTLAVATHASDRLDEHVYRYITHHELGRHHSLVDLRRMATPEVEVAFGLLFGLGLSIGSRSIRPFTRTVVVLGSVGGLVVALKFLLGRNRPNPLAPLNHPGLYGGFPSGHVAMTMAAVGAMSVALVGYRAARMVALACVPVVGIAAAAGLVGTSEHWFTDVVASWALVVMVVALAQAAVLDRSPPRTLGRQRELVEQRR
jgi:membrane-associated phospholipid phosphatase